MQSTPIGSMTSSTRSTDVVRFLVPVASVLVGAGVAIYAALASGRASAAAAFLGMAAGFLVLALWIIYRAARSLVEDAPAVEVERATGRRKKQLEREKQALLKALKELEFDHEMGKVSDPDFREIGGQYRVRAMRVLRQLDEAGADYKALVERELKARLAVPAAATAMATATATGNCEKCGTKNDEDAEFCKKCGKKLAA